VAQSLQSGATPDGGLTKRGTGTLTLSGVNTYNGATRIEEGTLKLGNAAGVPIDGDVTVAGGCYDLGGYTATNGAVVLDSGAINNGALAAATLTVADGTIRADLSGTGGLTKTGTGTVVLGGTSTYTGATRVEAGALRVGALPIHRWSFNGDLTDSVGGQAATAVGDVTSDGMQYTLTGGTWGTSYVALAANILPTTQTPVTIELWATQRSVKNWSRMIDFGYGQNDYIIMCWSVGTDINRDHVEVKVGGTVTSQEYTMSPFTLDTEYHVALVITPGAGTDGKTLFQWYKMDASGNTLGSGSMSASFSMANLPQVNMWLGHSEYTADNDANASYNELRVWSRAFTQEQLVQNSILGPDTLPTLLDDSLSPESAVSVASGGALDLGGSSQTVVGLDGDGVVSNGTLTVTGTVAPGGANVIGTLTVNASVALTGTLLIDVAADGASDLLQVGGALDLTRLALQIQDNGQLKPRERYVIAKCAPGGLTGPFETTNLDGGRWNVSYNNVSGEVSLISRGLLVLLR